jgi:SAM-dependent methyltransferase
MVTSPEPSGGQDWDPEYAALSGSDLLPRLAREALGDEYPFELRPYGFTTWPLLHEVLENLGPLDGGTLLDLGCGEGGPGLWLARAAGASLIGLDFSAEALRTAARWAQRFPQAPPARFLQASFTETGLPDQTVDAAVCLDALAYCPDPQRAFFELHRILRSGGRFVFTVAEYASGAQNGPGEVADHRVYVRAAGLVVRRYAEVPGWRERAGRLFELWLGHADALRGELGADVGGMLLSEAEDVLRRLDQRRQVLLVGERPRIPAQARPVTASGDSYRAKQRRF